MSYDEQVTPESDPPVVEPPPPVARLSDILAHTPPASRTEVVAALRPAEPEESDLLPQIDTVPPPLPPDAIVPEPAPVAPDPEPVEQEPEPVLPDPDPVVPDPVTPDPEPPAPEPEPVVPDPEPDPVTPDPEPPAPQPEPVVPDPEPPVPEPGPGPVPEPVPEPIQMIGDGLIERRCELCGTRVRVGPDDTHCPFRHKLSPAHAKAKRRWWQRP